MSGFEDAKPELQALQEMRYKYKGACMPVQFTNSLRLSEDQFKEVVRNSHLGRGINPLVSGFEAYSRETVVGPALLEAGQIDNLYVNQATQSTYVSQTRRSASHVAVGHSESTASIGVPLVVDTSLEVGFTTKEETFVSNEHIYVVGRWAYDVYQISFKTSSKLTAHPALRQEILDALAQSDKRKALDVVLEKWGSTVVTSAVVGGSRYKISEQTTTVEERASSYRFYMNIHVSAQMKGVAGSAGSNNSYEEADRRKAEQMFGSSSMNTIGGNATLSSAEDWFNSLNDPMLWTMTRPTKACSIVDLFKDDAEVYNRLKPIADAIAQEQRTLRTYICNSMPLYRTDNARTGDTFFSMTQREINEARPYGYQYHGLVARVLFPRPSTTACKPITRVRQRIQGWHLHYLTDQDAQNIVTGHGNVDREADQGYISSANLPGFVPLYGVAKQPDGGLYFMTDYEEFKNFAARAGHQYWGDGTVGYVLPPIL